MLFTLSAIIINSFLSFFCFFAEATPTPHSAQPPTIVSRQELAFADISIESVNYVPTGPGGCSGVIVTFAPGTYNIQIHYPYFGAWSDPSNPATAASGCHITWVVNHPADWAVGLNSDNTVSGSVYLPEFSNHTAYLSEDLSFGSGNSQWYYNSWQGPLEFTEFAYPSFYSTPVDFTGCPASTQTQFRLSTYLEVERQPIYGSIWLNSQTLSLEWDPCPPAI